MRTTLLAGACALLAISTIANAQIVTKVADDFSRTPWTASPWSRADGTISIDSQTPPDAGSGQSMKLSVRYAGTGFTPYECDPPSPLVIPGRLKELSVRVKISDVKYPVLFTFRDGWGRDAVNGRQLQWSISPKKADQWKTYTFKVPADWVQPIRINEIATHNYSAKEVKKTVDIWFNRLEATTDITDVDRNSGLLKGWTPEPNPKDKDKVLKAPPAAPLTQVNLGTGVEGNLFAGQTPVLNVTIRNWLSAQLKGTIRLTLADNDGKEIMTETKAVQADSSEHLSLPISPSRFGRYRLTARTDLGDGKTRETILYLGYVPKQPTLTEEQKIASPYGLNVHDGREHEAIAAFRAAGIVWFRDYAWDFGWMNRAKGESGKYEGWPNYPKILKTVTDLGGMILPDLGHSISPPVYNPDGSVKQMGPDAEWSRQMAQILLAFPTIKYWELGNEYDLNGQHVALERKANWKNFGLYHKRFSQLIGIMTNDQAIAVQNGMAGYRPDVVREMIRGGYYDGIGAVNFHHYCGTDAPEVNVSNNNTSQGGKELSLYFDELRTMHRIAQGDGRKRETWLTEFGWDTLAGKIVTPYQQAVYLQRAWMLGMAAGVDKQFWFYDYDSAEPSHFFDGMGLLDANGQAKLDICALAAMTAMLPSPKYVGSINAGEGTQGYIFRQGNQLVATLWNIDNDDGPKVTLNEGKLYDYLGNPIDGAERALSMAPIYDVGISTASPWYAQSAYDIHTDHLQTAAAGDPLAPVIRVHNNRQTTITGKILLRLPSGWTSDQLEHEFTVAPGKDADIPVPFTIDPKASTGMNRVGVLCMEAGRQVKEISQRVMVTKPLTLAVGPLEATPNRPIKVDMTIRNLSSRPRGGTLELKLPTEWKAESRRIDVPSLKPGETTTIQADLTWNTPWRSDEEATVTLRMDGGASDTQPLIPPAYQLPRVDTIALNGDLKDFPAAAKLPDWMLGSTEGRPNADVFLAWSPRGLYIGIDARDSKIVAGDPSFFWKDDTLELFIDTTGDIKNRKFATTDHQFWFVPLVDRHRVYVGEWSRGARLKEPRHDISGLSTYSARTKGGYVMEMLLPADQLPGWPARGGDIGLNLNLTVHGHSGEREVYWPLSKSQDPSPMPSRWGTMRLSN